MNMFTPDRLPVMTALASEFALFDRFFASHPGPTWPNRLFQLMVRVLARAQCAEPAFALSFCACQDPGFALQR